MEKEFRLGISRCFDYDGNLKEQWLRVAGNTVEELADSYAQLTQGVLAWPVTLHETPQDAPEKFREKVEEKPTGTSTPAQAKKILAVARKVDSEEVIKLLDNYDGFEYAYSEDGACLPSWDFLMSLKKEQASQIIQRLERAEA